MAERAVTGKAETWNGPGPREFVALMAALMASNALAIDAMLPALPAIGEGLGVGEANRRQLVITAYLIGFGMAQLAYGPLADRFGRKRLLLVSLILYTVFATTAGLATSFSLLLVSRVMQGVAAAGSRVLVAAIVRDRYKGSAMARIMSLVMIIFMIVPILAPSFGQGVLAISSWRHIFIGLAVYGLVLALWVGIRMPETLAVNARRTLSATHIGQAFAETLRSRVSIGNTLTVTLAVGSLFAFITSVQQIIFDVFHRPELIGLIFACVAGPMALTSYANSRLVHRFGSRRLLINALITFTIISLVHLTVAEAVGETIWSFTLMQALALACFGLVGSNASALAMEPLGHIAGTASSLQGVITMVGGALIGFAIGQNFNGTTTPFLIGFAICGALALVAAYWANPATGAPHGGAEEKDETIMIPPAAA